MSRSEFTPLSEDASRKRYAHSLAKFIAMVIRAAGFDASKIDQHSDSAENPDFWSEVKTTPPKSDMDSRDVADLFGDAEEAEKEDKELLAAERQQLQDEGLDDGDFVPWDAELDSDSGSEAGSIFADSDSDSDSDSGAGSDSTPRYPVSLTEEQKENALALKRELNRANATPEDIDKLLHTLLISIFTEDEGTYRDRHTIAPVEAFLFMLNIIPSKSSESSHTIRPTANVAPYLSHIQYLMLFCFAKQAIASSSPAEYVKVSSTHSRLNSATVN